MKLIISIMFCLIPSVVMWLAGYDFDKRGGAAVFIFLTTLMCFIYMYFAPWWKK